MNLLILLFLVPFSFAAHHNDESGEWTGQKTLTDGSGEEELSLGNDWSVRRPRRRHLHLTESEDDLSNPLSVNDWSSTDSASDNLQFEHTSDEDWEFNDLIFDADENCVKCPGFVLPCRCPSWQRCRFVQRTCRVCPHYICEK